MSNPADPSAADRAQVVDAELLRSWPLPVDAHGDKFARGTAVVIGGSSRTPGAARLAGEAALRMGAGRLEIVTAADVAVALGVAVPEALVVPLATDADDGLRWDSSDERLERLVGGADAVLVGPGLLGGAVADVVSGALRWLSADALVVLDARALAALGELEARLVPRGRLVLTPNRQELRTLASRTSDDECSLATTVAQQHDAVVTCFGHVTTAERCWEVRIGSPGLGTSGSGDVLAGLALGAAVRCRDAARAAAWATYVHAAAGASLASKVGELSFLARDLVAEVPAVLGSIES